MIFLYLTTLMWIGVVLTAALANICFQAYSFAQLVWKGKQVGTLKSRGLDLILVGNIGYWFWGLPVSFVLIEIGDLLIALLQYADKGLPLNA